MFGQSIRLVPQTPTVSQMDRIADILEDIGGGPEAMGALVMGLNQDAASHAMVDAAARFSERFAAVMIWSLFMNANMRLGKQSN